MTQNTTEKNELTIDKEFSEHMRPMTTEENAGLRKLLEEIVFREDLYPRIDTAPQKVQEYSETIDLLPPIKINQNDELIDGWHRWTAHKKAKIETIEVIVTETTSDGHLLELAIERNAKHGLQLSMSDKRDMARRIYTATDLGEQGEKKKKLAKILAVHYTAVNDWLTRIDKDNRDAKNLEISRRWFACYTEQEIEKKIGVGRKAIQGVLSEISNYYFCTKLGEHDDLDGDDRDEAIETDRRDEAYHQIDYDPPIYNVWKQQTKSEGASHFGNSEIRWVDNLLYLYTEPFQIVVDPFAGSGSTAELCKRRHRRYLVSDRIVQPELEGKHIREHDLTDGVLKPPQWKDVGLVYLDPPYWKQAEGQYSDDPTDLANMSYEDFTTALAKIVNGYLGKIPSGARVALIIQPTQWKAPEREYIDHVGDMLRQVKHPVEMRYSFPTRVNSATHRWLSGQKTTRNALF